MNLLMTDFDGDGIDDVNAADNVFLLQLVVLSSLTRIIVFTIVQNQS